MTAAEPTVDAALVRAFVQRVRLRRRRAVLGQAAVRSGLPAALLVAVALWWSKGLALALLGPALLAVGVALRIAFVRHRRAGAALAALDDAPRGFDDGLRTWSEQDQRGRGSEGMAAWLCADLAHELGSLQAPARVRVARPGRVRYLLPLCVLLLLVWLFVPVLPVPTPGLLGGAPPPGGGAGNGGAGGGGARDAEPVAAAADEPALPPPPEPEPEPEPEPQLGPPRPPPPLLELPPSPTTVVPDFVGDGPTRRALAERALVAAGSGAPETAAGGAEPLLLPQPTAHEFERAAERALRSRHVPEVERAIVARFFARLQQEGR